MSGRRLPVAEFAFFTLIAALMFAYRYLEAVSVRHARVPGLSTS